MSGNVFRVSLPAASSRSRCDRCTDKDAPTHIIASQSRRDPVPQAAGRTVFVLARSMSNDASESETLLCVTNFPKDTGFAWTFITKIYRELAEDFAGHGVQTLIAYPAIGSGAESSSDAAADDIEFEVAFDHIGSVLELAAMVRRRNIRVLYLADRASWHPAYLALRAAGVERIVVHDHTSGRRTRPKGLKRLLKWALARVPGMTADCIVGVSDFVVQRKVEVDMVPADRVTRVWNAVEMPDPGVDYRKIARERLGLPSGRPIVAAACRSTPEKGIQHLLRAFDDVCAAHESDLPMPLLIYLGDGPAMDELQAIRSGLMYSEDVLFTGYREDASEIVGGADVAVVPSVWEEAFGLSALEPMSHGVPVVASAVGGLPEVVDHGETGLLVPPSDERALARAISHLMANPDTREQMGRRGHDRARRCFSWPRLIDDIEEVLKEGFRNVP